MSSLATPPAYPPSVPVTRRCSRTGSRMLWTSVWRASRSPGNCGRADPAATPVDRHALIRTREAAHRGYALHLRPFAGMDARDRCPPVDASVTTVRPCRPDRPPTSTDQSAVAPILTVGHCLRLMVQAGQSACSGRQSEHERQLGRQFGGRPSGKRHAIVILHGQMGRRLRPAACRHRLGSRHEGFDLRRLAESWVRRRTRSGCPGRLISGRGPG